MTTGYDLREGSQILADRRRKEIARLAREALRLLDEKRAA